MTNNNLSNEEAMALAKSIFDEKHKHEYHLYDFRIDNFDIAIAKQELLQYLTIAANGKLTRGQLETAIYQYLQVVYDNTFERWNNRRLSFAREYNLAHPKYAHLPIDTVKISSRELDYISERWRNWCWLDGDYTFYEDFDNNIGEQDYSHIELPDTTIRSADYVLEFGKWHPSKHNGRRITIREVWQREPKYLVWMHNNTDRKISDELMEETLEWVKKYDRISK